MSPNVLAVGGTTLTLNGNNYGGEIGWGSGQQSGTFGGGGGGISQFESQPTYQQGTVTQSSTHRTTPDVSMEADPATGVPVYDSYDDGSDTPWFPSQVGGTSLACPMWAGLISIVDENSVSLGQGVLDGPTQTLPRIYQLPGSDFHDITSGSNGFNAGTGYDLVTGRGSPIVNNLVPDMSGQLIGDFVFQDSNDNGIQDPGESGIQGVQILLENAGPDGIIGTGDDSVVASTTSDSTGHYAFRHVTAGNYYIHFSTPTGFHISPQLQGNDPALDSDPDPNTGNTQLIPVTASTIDNTIDCGMFSLTLHITNVQVTEGNSGFTPAVFTVTITPTNTNTVIVPFTTVDGTATVADHDYVGQSGALTFGPGVVSQTITVDVVGDLKIENDEAFTVTLTVPSGFSSGPVVGTCTIINDDFPAASVPNNDAMIRPSSGSVNFPFTVTLSATAPFNVSVPYSTIDNSAVGGIDFTETSGTLIFTPGETSQTIQVPVFGGTNPQLDKTFFFAVDKSSTVTVGTPARDGNDYFQFPAGSGRYRRRGD